MVKVRVKAFADARKKLVEELKTLGVYDENVLEAFLNVPRHVFVPEVLVFDAYKNSALPMGYGQTVSQPLTVALMTQELDLEKNDKVLEIGTGSGFQSAILSYIVNKVYTVEVIESFIEKAKKAHKRVGLKNIFYKLDNGNLGWRENAPFDKIIVTAALNHHPVELYKQLKKDGIMIYPFIDSEKQKLCKIFFKNGRLVRKFILDCNFVIAV